MYGAPHIEALIYDKGPAYGYRVPICRALFERADRGRAKSCIEIVGPPLTFHN